MSEVLDNAVERVKFNNENNPIIFNPVNIVEDSRAVHKKHDNYFPKILDISKEYADCR